MSRWGDLLRTERLRRNMTLKQVAKIGGVSEGYLKDVEEGRRITADDQARRILKQLSLIHIYSATRAEHATCLSAR